MFILYFMKVVIIDDLNHFNLSSLKMYPLISINFKFI